MYDIECQPFPQFLESRSELVGHLCYFMEPYEPVGYSVSFITKDGNVCFKITDTDGNHVLWEEMPAKYEELIKITAEFCGMLRILKIAECQAFFSVIDGKVTLVDVFNKHKFIGPGMLNDIFSKFLRTPKIIKVAAYKEDNADTDVVIKPSRFMTVMIDGNPTPLYIKK